MNYGEVITEWIDYGTCKGWFVVDPDSREPLEGPFDDQEDAELSTLTERYDEPISIGGLYL